VSGPRDVFGLIGTTIAERVRVERVLGEGGFGVVYGGTHLALGAQVAIKCLKPSGDTETEKERAADLFLREGRILFGLTHPAIVRLYDVGVIPDRAIPYAVLELLSGETLAAHLASRAAARQPLSKVELATLFLPILEGVGFAHERGVVHRDLKPANIMLVSDGTRMTPKVLDFGTARGDGLGTGPVGMATAGTIGTGFTPLYAAPEQWDGSFGRTGPHTDVYALGVTLAEACLLAYPLPYTDSLLSIWRAATDETTRPSLVSRPDLSPDVQGVILRAMRVRPAERFADARDMLIALRRALDVSPTTAPLARPLAPSSAPSSAPREVPRAEPMTSPPVARVPSAASGYPEMMPIVAPRRASALPWIIGGAGLLVASLAVGVGVLVAVGPDDRGRAQAAKASETAETELDDTKAAAPAATLVPAPRRPFTGKLPQLVLRSAIGMQPFWTQLEVTEVARSHHGELTPCVEAGVEAEPALGGLVAITVHPSKEGVVDSVDCSVVDHDEGEDAFCACAERVLGKWRYPPAHGKLGRLASAPFIYDYVLKP
jgi:eukaryotic-like serine/threonine-protein kinase